MTADKNLEKIEKRMFSITQSGKELQSEMQGLAKAVNKLNDSDGLGKTWGIISRMSSGIFPNFWSIQNKVRAVTIMFDNHYKKQREQVAKQIESITVLENLQKIPEGLDLDHDSLRGAALNQHFNKMKGQIEEFASIENMYKSALKQDELTDDVKKLLLTNMKDQVKPTARAREKLEERARKGIKRELELQEINENFKNSPVRRFFAKQKLALTNFVQGGAKLFKILFIFLSVFSLGFVLLIKSVQLLGHVFIEAIDELGEYVVASLTFISNMLGIVGSGLADIVNGFSNGEFFLVLGGLLKVLLGGFMVVVGLGILALELTLGVIISLLWNIVESLFSSAEEAINTLSGILITIGLVLGVLVSLGVIAATWPVILGGVIITGIGLLLSTLTDKLDKMFDKLIPDVKDFIPKFSSGGVVNSNIQLVGERGAELVSLPRGSRVYSNANSRRMLGGSGGNTIHVHVNGRVGASDAEIKDIANKVAREINLRMSRTGSGVNNF